MTSEVHSLGAPSVGAVAAGARTHDNLESPIPSQTTTFFEPLDDELEAEIRRDEARIEMYGGDDPEDPPSETDHKGVPKTGPLTNDSNLVTWDGPNDPENPQNWSYRYKWFVTVICSLMTVNVCVFS